MPQHIGSPTRIEAPGNKPKLIDEYFGLINTGDAKVSIAYTHSPGGWQEPGQCPEFHEFTVVLKGMIRCEHAAGSTDVEAGQGIHAHPHEWIRYSTPLAEGAEYITVCLPSYSRAVVHRDE
jgi:mannose-6-phosphate isomerase-like protein (cupin superfamily)